MLRKRLASHPVDIIVTIAITEAGRDTNVDSRLVNPKLFNAKFPKLPVPPFGICVKTKMAAKKYVLGSRRASKTCSTFHLLLTGSTRPVPPITTRSSAYCFSSSVRNLASLMVSGRRKNTMTLQKLVTTPKI